MQYSKIVILLFGLVSLSNCVLANQDGDGVKDPVLSGSVLDAFSKKPLKGVTVSVTSAKDRSEKLFTTDDLGQFNVSAIPAGEVTIVLEKKGYKTYRREKVLVKQGTQLKLKFDISNDREEAEDNNLFHPLLRMMEI